MPDSEAIKCKLLDALEAPFLIRGKPFEVNSTRSANFYMDAEYSKIRSSNSGKCLILTTLAL